MSVFFFSLRTVAFLKSFDSEEKKSTNDARESKVAGIEEILCLIGGQQVSLCLQKHMD